MEGSPPLLALETSTTLGGVAVARGERLLAETVVGVRARHAESLLPAVDGALAAAGVAVGEVAGVVVGAGPGSFTGVRIAAATAKGLVRALGVPLYAYSSLAALAATAGEGARPVCALFDARRGEVYAACYAFPGFARVESVMPPCVAPVEEVLERLGAAPTLLFAGEGAHRYAAVIREAGGEIAPEHLSVPRASALLWLARMDPAGGRVSSPGTWEPDYLRGAGAERARAS